MKCSIDGEPGRWRYDISELQDILGTWEEDDIVGFPPSLKSTSTGALVSSMGAFYCI